MSEKKPFQVEKKQPYVTFKKLFTAVDNFFTGSARKTKEIKSGISRKDFLRAIVVGATSLAIAPLHSVAQERETYNSELEFLLSEIEFFGPVTERIAKIAVDFGFGHKDNQLLVSLVQAYLNTLVDQGFEITAAVDSYSEKYPLERIIEAWDALPVDQRLPFEYSISSPHSYEMNDGGLARISILFNVAYIEREDRVSFNFRLLIKNRIEGVEGQVSLYQSEGASPNYNQLILNEGGSGFFETHFDSAVVEHFQPRPSGIEPREAVFIAPFFHTIYDELCLPLKNWQEKNFPKISGYELFNTIHQAFIDSFYLKNHEDFGGLHEIYQTFLSENQDLSPFISYNFDEDLSQISLKYDISSSEFLGETHLAFDLERDENGLLTSMCVVAPAFEGASPITIERVIREMDYSKNSFNTSYTVVFLCDGKRFQYYFSNSLISAPMAVLIEFSQSNTGEEIRREYTADDLNVMNHLQKLFHPSFTRDKQQMSYESSLLNQAQIQLLFDLQQVEINRFKFERDSLGSNFRTNTPELEHRPPSLHDIENTQYTRALHLVSEPYIVDDWFQYDVYGRISSDRISDDQLNSYLLVESNETSKLGQASRLAIALQKNDVFAEGVCFEEYSPPANNFYDTVEENMRYRNVVDCALIPPPQNETPLINEISYLKPKHSYSNLNNQSYDLLGDKTVQVIPGSEEYPFSNYADVSDNHGVISRSIKLVEVDGLAAFLQSEVDSSLTVTNLFRLLEAVNTRSPDLNKNDLVVLFKVITFLVEHSSSAFADALLATIRIVHLHTNQEQGLIKYQEVDATDSELVQFAGGSVIWNKKVRHVTGQLFFILFEVSKLLGHYSTDTLTDVSREALGSEEYQLYLRQMELTFDPENPEHMVRLNQRLYSLHEHARDDDTDSTRNSELLFGERHWDGGFIFTVSDKYGQVFDIHVSAIDSLIQIGDTINRALHFCRNQNWKVRLISIPDGNRPGLQTIQLGNNGQQIPATSYRSARGFRGYSNSDVGADVAQGEKTTPDETFLNSEFRRQEYLMIWPRSSEQIQN